MAVGAAIGAAVLAWLWVDDAQHAPGPMNTGHGTVACEACHLEAPGTLRQQLQNATRDWLGLAATTVDVGYRRVTNTECMACHERPDDRHPVFRFLEPRFAEVRETLHPERCTSCHREHHGVRVTMPETTYCRHCHGELTMKTDPLDVPHAELVATQRWDTCLGCHDFHGNHAMPAPRRIQDAIPRDAIRAYFEGGRSPYGEPTRRATHKELPP